MVKAGLPVAPLAAGERLFHLVEARELFFLGVGEHVDGREALVPRAVVEEALLRRVAEHLGVEQGPARGVVAGDHAHLGEQLDRRARLGVGRREVVRAPRVGQRAVLAARARAAHEVFELGHHHVEPEGREPPRGREPGDAPAHDEHVAARLSRGAEGGGRAVAEPVPPLVRRPHDAPLEATARGRHHVGQPAEARRADEAPPRDAGRHGQRM
jgi:hypothetical protein